MLDHSPRRWMFFRTGTSLWFRPPARRRSTSRLRTIEAIEARCMLSASGLISELVSSQSGTDSRPLIPHQIFPPIESPYHPQNAASSIQKLLNNAAREIAKDLDNTMGSGSLEPRETTGLPSVGSQSSAVTVTVSNPTVSSKTQTGNSGWTITFYFRPRSDSSLGSNLSSSLSNASRGQSSLRRSLVDSSFGSSVNERIDQKWSSDSSKTLLLDWSSMTAEPAVSVSTTSELQKSAAMLASDSSSAGASALPSESPIALAIAAASESSDNFTAAGTTDRPERFAFLPIDSSNSAGSFTGTSASSQSFQNSLTTFFTNEQLARRFDPAAARPVTTPQTPQPESDLILTGKQGRKIVAESTEDADSFFRHSFKFLLSPENEGAQQKLDQTKPDVPGSEGNVDPGHTPKGNEAAPAPAREGADDDMKEGSMTWAGLLLAAASGFRSLRRRRKRQRTAA